MLARFFSELNLLANSLSVEVKIGCLPYWNEAIQIHPSLVPPQHPDEDQKVEQMESVTQIQCHFIASGVFQFQILYMYGLREPPLIHGKKRRWLERKLHVPKQQPCGSEITTKSIFIYPSCKYWHIWPIIMQVIQECPVP